MTTNCPNCGAPISGCKCDYCGTMFYDFTELPVDGKTPTFIRMKFHPFSDQTIMMRVLFSDVEKTYWATDDVPEIMLRGRVLHEVYEQKG